ncbi:MAG: hypothetical protein IRZ09_04775 [Variibacter sp.]|nr:hypothetical protein [Variibacter sp.]
MDRTTTGDGEPNVLRFRRRARGGGVVRRVPRAHASLSPFHSPIADVGKYERSSAERDDYTHRMLVNAAGFLVCALLVAAGVWIVSKMAEIRRDQDCVLSGRRNCAQIGIVGPAR